MLKFMGKVFLLSLFGLFLVTVVFIITFVYKPNLIINTNNARRILWLVAPSETNIQWKTLKIDAKSPRFLVHDYQLTGKGICINESKVEGCIPLISINVRINFRRWPYVVETIGPAQVQGDRFIVRPSFIKKENEAPFNWEKLYSHLSRISWEPLVVELRSLTIYTQEKPKILSGIRVVVSRTSQDAWTLRTQLSSAREFPIRRLRLQSTVHLNRSIDQLWQEIVASAQGETMDGKKIALRGSVKRLSQQDAFSLSAHGLMTKKQGSVNFDGRGSWRRGVLDLTLDGAALRIDPYISRIAATRCRISGDLPVAAEKKILLNLYCPIVAKPNLKLPSSVHVEDWPQTLSMIARGELELPRGRGKDLRAELNFKASPIFSSIFRLVASTNLTFQRPEGKDFKLEAWDIAFDGKVTRFSKLVKALENSPWAIPAPLRAFQGEIGCTAQGGLELKSNDVLVPILCNTDLLSQKQEFQADAKGLFRIQKQPSGWQPSLTANVQVKKAQLEVPDIDWRKSFPQLFTDKRISLSTTEASPIKPRFDYVISINTTKGSPVKLLSNLAGGPMPIELKNIRFSSRDPLTGIIVFHSFGLRLLKQRASLKKFVITYPGGGNAPLLDGSFDIYNVDYTIKLAVVGTTSRPRIEVFSDPPRTQSELLSAVIFGNANELNSDQMRSVEEARAAIADGAISLISMYYLAATPIDSIGYNPYTGIVRAKVKLNDRTSLTIGSDLRSQQTIGLRRRLSPNWSVETTAQHNTESEQQSERAMLRWAKRY